MGKVHLGINKANPRETVQWETTEVVNGHWIVVGGSGSGKTHRIRDVATQLQTQGMRMHVFDPHGDIDTDPAYTSAVEFSETSPYGINPLAINPSPAYGGVRKRINSLIRTINKYSSKLNEREEAVMRYALKELYALHGFHYSNPGTWAQGSKRMPTLDDLHRFIYQKLKGFFLGHMYEVSDLLDRLNDGLLTLRRLRRYRDMEQGEEDADLLTQQNEQRLDALKKEIETLFGKCIRTLRADDVDQHIRYDSKEVLKSLYDRIEKLQALGVFKSEPPPFDPDKAIWRYDMKTLYVEEQGYLVELTLGEIFAKAIECGFKSEVDTMIFIDEAQRFISSDDQDHIISTIFREIRKFGGGLLLSTQNCEMFPTDIIINSGTKMILGVDEAYQDILAKKLGVEKIRFIQPRKNALIQINTRSTSVGSRFIDTLFKLPQVSG